MNELQEKKVTVIPREEKNFICRRCKQEVDVSKAEPWIIETDKEIIKTWDYGHRHNKMFRVIGGKQYLIQE